MREVFSKVDEVKVSRHMRKVSFIHRPVTKCLDGHSQFQDLSWRSVATHARQRGNFGVIVLAVSHEIIKNGDRQPVSIGRVYNANNERV